jgi:DNA-binding CsgD family transcriptional regulator
MRTGSHLANCIEAIGTSAFSDQLMVYSEDLVRADHLSLFAFDAELKPVLAEAATRGGSDTAVIVGKRYQDSLHFLHDPNTTHLRAAPALSNGPLLTRLKASEITDPAYRAEIYDHFGLLDRVSIMDGSEGQWRVLNLYRDRATGAFTKREIDRIAKNASLLSALVGKHLSLSRPIETTDQKSPPLPVLEQLIAALQGGLTEREVAVCARALSGMTGTGIALDLGVKEPTVATLRQRAYARLNISTLNELFALCLGAMARRSPPG